MSYEILYRSKKTKNGISRGWSKSAFVVCFFVLFLRLVRLLWPEGDIMLRSLLYPGDPAVTASALQMLTEELSSGAGVYDAIRHFCVQILEGAGFGAG